MIEERGRRSEASTPLDDVDVLLTDLDGVVHAGAGPLPHAVEALTRAAVGRPIGFLTTLIKLPAAYAGGGRVRRLA